MEQLIDGYLLSPLQKRAWDLRQQAHTYNTLIRVEVDGSLEISRLTNALQKVGQRHEIFRTAFFRQRQLQYPVQVINEEYRPHLEFEDIGNLDDSDQAGRLTAIRHRLLAHTFNLSSSGLLNAFVVRLAMDRHILFLYSHPLAADAETMYNVAAELLEWYTGQYSAGDDPGEPLQFLQYSEWQNETLSEGSEEAETYWESRHFLADNRLPLPFVHPNEYPGFTPPRTLKVPITGTLYQTIDKYVKDTRKSLPDLIFACWMTWIWQHAGCPEDIAFDRVESGRRTDAFNAINGLMARPLPFYTRIMQRDTFEDLYRRVAEEGENNRLFQDHCESGGKGCDIVYESYKMGMNVISRGNITFHIDSIDAFVDRFNMKLRLIEYAERWDLDLHYYPDQVSAASVEWTREQLTTLMTAITNNPGAPLKDLMTVSEKERAFLLFEVNSTRTSFMPTDYISLFEQQVDKTPFHPAVYLGDEEWTYLQLDKRANQVAAFLAKEKAVVKGDIVAVKMARSPLLLASLLGIMKTGAVFLPIDIHSPAERIDFILRDSGARLLLTDESFSADTGSFPDHRSPVPITPDDLVYIIYTSGSTGRPKGTLISHGSFTNYLQWAKRSFDINETDRTLLFSSIAFDLAYTSLWTALISGSELHILEEAPCLEPDVLISRLIEKKITFIKLTASHFNLIAGDPEFEKNVAKYSLRLIVLGGEHIRPADVEKYIIRLANHTCFVSHYGPTETTIGVIAGVIDTERFSASAYTPVIGRPIDNNQVYILNEGNQLCPIGIPGEIGISGAGLAKGYLQRDELTREKFIPHPFISGQTLYRTGDIGKWTADGRIHLLGRNDDQVKIRGYRVETGEIEKVLAQHPQIRQAVVLPVTTGPDGPSLKAFLTITGSPLNTSGWKAGLRDTLPEYMIPEHFVIIPEFPLLPNGKIDKQALLNVRSTGMDDRRGHTPPKTRTEETVADVWKAILIKDIINTDESFFNCGGNSLKLVRVFRELAKLFPDKKLTVAELFKYTTIQAISGYLDHDDTSRLGEGKGNVSVYEF